jgi:hypothetical protein
VESRENRAILLYVVNTTKGAPMYKLIMYIVEDGKRVYREWIDSRYNLARIYDAASAAGYRKSRLARVA